MPFAFHHSISTIADLWVWKIEESEEELKKGLRFRPHLQKRLNTFKTESKRVGVLAVQQLLLKAGINPDDMLYDATGIPRLPSQHISISHARGYAAIGIGLGPIGVDVEYLREQVQRIKTKFVHNSEDFAQSTSELIQLWTAKEAVYKAAELPGIHLNQHLLVQPFEQGLAQISHPQKKQSYSLYFFDLDQHKATVAIQNH